MIISPGSITLSARAGKERVEDELPAAKLTVPAVAPL